MPTQLSPLEETLFQSWARAHRIENHDDPSNSFDHRGVYKRTNGLIHPPGHLNQLADEHNAAAEASEGAGGTAIDPAMAAVEHQKNQMEAQKADREQKLKVHLAERAHAQKMELEHMKIQAKAMEADKDRQQQAQEAERTHQMEAQQAQADRQMQAQQAHEDRQSSLQDTLMQRQNQVQDQAQAQQSNVHGKLLAEHLTRTRPKPKPTAPAKTA